MSDRTRIGVLVMAHGTPARLEDLETFYTEIRRGHPPAPEQLAELAARYRAIGGTSPLNATTRSQALGLAKELERREPARFVVHHGARFADPRIEAAAEALVSENVDGIVGVVMAPHSARMSVGEYERRARLAVDGRVPFVMVDHWYDAPGFAPMLARRVDAALESLAPDVRRHATTIYSAHSIPLAAAVGDPYAAQVAESADAVAALTGGSRHVVAWQSAGRTDDEWLGPTLRAVIEDEARLGTPAVVLCPIGFVADHLEVLYDVDVEARAVAEEAGTGFARTASLDSDEDFCALLADVVLAATARGGGDRP